MLRHFKKVRVYIAIFAIITVLQWICAPWMGEEVKPKAATNNEASHTDIVLVLDSSKSMEKSDPESISMEAMKMFIDMCHVQGDKIGMVAYSGDIIKESSLKTMNNSGDKQQLKDALNTIQLGQWTDIGIGLKRAVEVLEGGHEASHKPLIVLLSDGKNDPSRSKSQSESDLNNALKTAKDKGYPIYTIGLNADGTVDKKQLEQISNNSNAKNFITNTANDLPQILREIFAENSQLKIVKGGNVQANGEYQDVKINIPDSNVVEANISLLSSKPVELKLFDSKGQEQTIPSNNVVLSASKKYSMVKIINPSQGDWLLKVKGIKGDQIDISLLFNYDLQVVMNLSPNSNVHKGDKIKVTSFIISNNQRVQDGDLYGKLTGKLAVKDLQGGGTKEIALASKGDHFEGEYTLADSNPFELKVRVEGPSFYRESSAVQIGVGNRPPQILHPIESSWMSLGGKGKQIDLSKVFSDPDKDSLSYKIEVNPEKAAETVVQGEKLNIVPKEKGTAEITVTASDGKGGSVKQTFKIKIVSIVSTVLITLFVIAFIAGAIIEFIYYKRKNRKFVGEVMLQIRDEVTGKMTPPQYRKLTPYKGSTTLHHLLELDPRWKETAKVILEPAKGDKLVLINKSSCIIQQYGMNKEASKGLEIGNNVRVTVVLPQTQQTITMEYSY